MSNKLYSQYRDKPKAVSLSNIPLDFREQIVSACDFVENSYDIDSNGGEQLDVIGRIVDKDRGFIETIVFDVYQMNSDGDYEMGDSEVQMSPLTAAGDSDLNDDYYRYLLKSKIIKNNSDATIDDILTAINVAIPGIDATRLIDGEDMTFSIEFYGSIDAIARDLLLAGELIPRPQGVKFRGFLEGVNLVEMNSDGEFNMGDTSAEMVGFLGA